MTTLRHPALGLVLAAGLTGCGASRHGAAPAPSTPPAPTKVDDFQLADQNLLARHLYKMKDAKAVVLTTYAAGDAATSTRQISLSSRTAMRARVRVTGTWPTALMRWVVSQLTNPSPFLGFTCS